MVVQNKTMVGYEENIADQQTHPNADENPPVDVPSVGPVGWV